MSEQQNENNLQLEVRRREDQGTVEIGVMVEGAFLPLAAYKLGWFDNLVQQAKDDAQQREQQQQTEQQQQPQG
jgi:hypothetical protein